RCIKRANFANAIWIIQDVTMTPQYITVSQKNGLATITLNRADKRNAMNGDMIHELDEALQTLATDQHIRVLLINGQGDHFCAGADIAWMQTVGTMNKMDNQRDANALATLLWRLHEFPKPTIVLAHGTA